MSNPKPMPDNPPSVPDWETVQRSFDEYDSIAACSPSTPWCADPTYGNLDHYDGHPDAKRAALDVIRAAVAHLRQQHAEEVERLKARTYAGLLAWRGLDGADTVCTTCDGSGVRAYGSTSTWLGGIGGSMITSDVCDRCWGSGNAQRPWTSHREILALRLDAGYLRAVVDGVVPDDALSLGVGRANEREAGPLEFAAERSDLQMVDGGDGLAEAPMGDHCPKPMPVHPTMNRDRVLARLVVEFNDHRYPDGVTCSFGGAF
jgi:hypothetical protein